MKIACVIVTYNRLEKLKKVLDCHEKAIKKPDYIVVLDNNSNDGTSIFLSNWKKQESPIKKIVINKKENLGGAGGFHEAIMEALKLSVDWIYIADDDAYVYEDTLGALEKEYKKNPDVVALCSKVVDEQGINFEHRRTYHLPCGYFKEVFSRVRSYNKDSFDIKLFSFVGALVKKDVIEKVGLPRKDFFIWYDDTEFSLRVSKEGRIVCCPSSVIYHDTVVIKDSAVNWKHYYGFRNKGVTIKEDIGRWPYLLYSMNERIGILKNKIKGKKLLATIRKDALYDIKHNNMGISKKYYPGSKL